MALIEINRVFKQYKVNGIITNALRGVDLIVEKGSFISIAGPSGSGKTTLLNLIGALDKPDNGQILFEGSDITKINQSDLSDFRLKRIGFVFQAYNLIPSLTVLENVEFIMQLQGLDKFTRRVRAAEFLDIVGLIKEKNKRVNFLCGGQQQRVAVARAIASKPDVILADEPTANLDSDNAVLLLNLMRQLNREKQMTFIFSTHDKLVMDMADKVYHMRDGVIE